MHSHDLETVSVMEISFADEQWDTQQQSSSCEEFISQNAAAVIEEKLNRHIAAITSICIASFNVFFREIFSIKQRL